MKRSGLLTIGLFLTIVLAAGVIWATSTNLPAEEPDTVELPQAELPVDTVPAVEVGFCPSIGTCNTIPCDSGGCYSEPTTDEVDLGFRCCLDNGVLFQCPMGETVHESTSPCGGNASCPDVRRVYSCS